MLFLEKANKRESTWNNSIIVTAWVLLDVVDLAQLGRAVPSSVELSSTGGNHFVKPIGLTPMGFKRRYQVFP